MQSSEALSSFPSEFSFLNDPPSQLFFRGNTSLLQLRKISIVGSRKAYPYSRSVVHNLAKELSRRNVCVVSGAAMGIDAIAHEGADEKTIGILANGLDIVYPKVNAKLLKKMSEQSLLLSEYEDGVKARSYSFVHRNRLVVALGEVLVVAQADLDSGSMRSVEYAQQLGKKIYVIPHRLGESEGTQQLLREGKAELITDIQAFADRFGSYVPIEDAFLDFCSHAPAYEETRNFDAQKLFEYELLGKIKVVNGKVYLN